MSDPEAVRIAFECEAPGMREWADDVQRATVEIVIGAGGTDNVGDWAFNSVVRLLVGGHGFEIHRVLYGYEIRGFVKNLQEAYDTLEGSARLVDWDGDTLLCVTALERRRGCYAIGGRFVPIVLDTTATSEDRYVPASEVRGTGVVVAFEGLTLDRSLLADPLLKLQRFVLEHPAECNATGGYPPT